jgi:hypothetical protein
MVVNDYCYGTDYDIMVEVVLEVGCFVFSSNE